MWKVLIAEDDQRITSQFTNALRELAECVTTAVNELPDDLRTAITLREIEGLSYEDIANAMACPVGTVRSRLHRARKLLQDELFGYAKVNGYLLPIPYPSVKTIIIIIFFIP